MSLAANLWFPLLGVALLWLSLAGNPGITAETPGWTLLGGGFLLVVCTLRLAYYQNPPPSWPTRLAAGLAFSGLLSLATTPSAFLSLVQIAALSGFLAIMLVFEAGLKERWTWRCVATCLVVLCSCHALYGVFFWPATSGVPFKANFTNPDCYSLIVVIGTLLAVGLAIETSGWRRMILGLICLGLVAVVFFTASRASAFALTGGYLCFLLVLASSRSRALRGIASKLFVVPLCLGLAVALFGGSSPLMEKWFRLARGDDQVALKSRLDVVLYSYRSWRRSPLIGSGLGTFHLIYQQDRPRLAAGEDYMNVAHNDYIQWLVETGIVGFTAWMLLLLSTSMRLWRSIRSPTPWVAAQLGSTVAIACYCAFNFACPVPADLYWIGASLGLSASLSNLSGSVETKIPRWVAPLALILMAWGVWSINFGRLIVASSKFQAAAESAQAVLDWEGAAVQWQAACQALPGDVRLQLKLADTCRRMWAFTNKKTWLEAHEQALLHAHSSSPRDLQVLMNLGAFYQDVRQLTEARKYIQLATALAPNSPQVRRMEARNLILEGRLDRAAQCLADIEANNSNVHDQALAELVFLLESQQRGAGCMFLHRVATQDPSRACLIGLQAADVGKELKDAQAVLRLLKELGHVAPSRLDIQYEIALAKGASGQTDMELQTLEKLRKNSHEESGNDLVLEKVWQRWAQIQVQRGMLSTVTSQLEDYKIYHPRQLWVYKTLADIFLQRGMKSEARAALRDGVPYDRDGSLRVRLGDLCAAQGLTELARSYFTEALTVSSERKSIEARISQLKTVRNSDDADLLPGDSPSSGVGEP